MLLSCCGHKSEFLLSCHACVSEFLLFDLLKLIQA